MTIMYWAMDKEGVVDTVNKPAMVELFVIIKHASFLPTLSLAH